MTKPDFDLEDLGLDRGAHVLLRRWLANAAVDDRLVIRSSSPSFFVDLPAWCRAEGHALDGDVLQTDSGWRATLIKGSAVEARWSKAERAGDSPSAVEEHANATWGLAARGALVEAGGPKVDFDLCDRDVLWSEDAGRIYAQAVAAQWDPETAIPWKEKIDLPVEVEDAVRQVMTYLVENETAALVVPARFLGRIHPHFREVLQVLSVQLADEARHIEVFTRRALLNGEAMGTSSAGGQASLITLLEEPDFALASFMLSVLGEGSFLSLLRFLERHAPDPVTRRIASLTGQDEARHVAFGMAHLSRHAKLDPSLLSRMKSAVERRHGALEHTAGLNKDVFDALVLLAAGSFAPADIRAGFDKVVELERDMDAGRRRRLQRLGFEETEAEHLSSLHTKNFM